MSHFLFGTFDLSDGHNFDLPQLSFELCQIGCRHDVFLAFTPLSKGHDVMTMLTDNGLAVAEQLPFVVTRSPIHDTSDELISPYRVVIDYSANIRLVGDRLHNVFKDASTILTEFHASLLVSEGYDVGFNKIQISINNLTDVLVEHLAREDDVPSLWMDIRPH